MSIQLADAKPVDPRVVHEAPGIPVTVVSSDVIREDRRMTASRGIAIGVLIALPFWALIAFTIYLLE
jgi:hypothetical protein